MFTTNFYEDSSHTSVISDYDDENEGELIGGDDEDLKDEEDFPADDAGEEDEEEV